MLKIEQKLETELIKEKQKFNNNPEIRFVDSKFRYELEVPLYLISRKKPDGYEETSARNGFQRYHTKTIKELADSLLIEEERLKNELKPFITSLMSMFYAEYSL